jgi:hypothetical protein
MRRCVPLAVLVGTLVAAACGPSHLTLPTGPGTPAPDYAPAFATALVRCHDVRTLSAELALSGHAGAQRLRGRVLAGFAPGALRLEAVAPGGSPAFILVADDSRGRLLLPRDRRVLDGAAPADILDALVGIALGPDDLRALLSGCVKASAEPAGARAYGTEWIVVDLTGGGAVYLRRGADGTWRIAAGSYGGLQVEYGELVREVPVHLQIRSSNTAGRSDVDLAIDLSQVEVNGDLPRDQLVALAIPPGTSPITLDQLRRSGPLGQ